MQQSAGLIVGVRPAYACASRAGTPSAITLPAKVLAAGSALAFWRRRSSVAEEKRERFAGMEWADAPESLDADGCEMLGLENDGSTWYACTEPAEGLDCEQNVSVEANGFICKEPAPKSS